MNKVVNLFSLVLLTIYMFLTLGVIYDLSFSVYHVNTIPFIQPIVAGLTVGVLLLGLIRIRRRWEGQKDLRRFKGFTFSAKFTQRHKNNVTIFLALETLFSIGFITILLKVLPLDSAYYVLPMLGVLALITIENIIFTTQFRQSDTAFRLGISKQLIAYFDREMHLYYYKGLQRVEIYQDMVNFKYKKDLNLFLPLNILSTQDQLAFLKTLHDTIGDSVFFDSSYQQYINKLSIEI